MPKLTSSSFDVLLILVGIACVVFAGFLIYTPAGWALLGSALILAGYVRQVIAFARREGD